MTPMIWNFVIIGAVVLIFLVMIRRLPVAARFVEKEKEKELQITPQKLADYSQMSQADEAFEAKKYDVAEDLYIKIAAHEPNNPKVYNQLGVIYLDQKNYYDAKDAFLQSIKLDPSNIEIFIDLGHAYMGLKDYFKASQSYMKAIEQEPKNKKYRELYEKAQKALDKEKKRKK